MGWGHSYSGFGSRKGPLSGILRKIGKTPFALAVTLVLMVQASWADQIPRFRGFGAYAPGASQVAPLDTTPSNPLASPAPPADGTAGSDQACLSSPMFQGMLPDIPNLQGGYLFQFGGKTREGRLTLDYMVPKLVNGRDVIFAQTHARFHDLFKTLGGSPFPPIQWLLGGGYRKRFADSMMLGGTCFLNANRLNTFWYSSAIVGLEMAVVTAGEGIATINYNYYGNLFDGTSGIFAFFNNKPGDYRIQIAYIQPVLWKLFNLRLKGAGYKLHREPILCGWNIGADLSTSNGAFTFRYDLGFDQMNENYHVVGVQANVGFQIQNLFRGENPFTRY